MALLYMRRYEQLKMVSPGETSVSSTGAGKPREMYTGVTSLEYQIAAGEGPFKASRHKAIPRDDETLSAISIGRND